MGAYVVMHGIRKQYPGVLALDAVDLEVALGEVHALVGENGAGKTTLARILSGATRRDDGDIIVGGKLSSLSSPTAARQCGIVSIQQHFSLIPNMSVAENIIFGHYPAKAPGLLDWRKTRNLAKELLDSIGFSEIDVRRPTGELSVADRQKVEIAKALYEKPRVLIMDEPSAVLPRDDVEKLHSIVRRLKAAGVGIVLISHNLPEVFALADRITVLRDGKRIATVETRHTSEEQVVRMMVGREIGELYPREHHVVGETVLSATNLVTDALKGVNLNLRKGEILGIAGLVGSGRTQLCEALFGIAPLRQGTITVEGRLARIRCPKDAIRLGMAFVTEDRHATGLILPMSVQCNISFVGYRKITRLGMIDHAEDARVAREYVEKLSISTPSIKQIVEYLSGGNQQKVVIAKWLYSEPKILILDEPTRGVDVRTKVEVYRLINRLVREGVAVLMVSSDLPEVLGLSDRVLVMREGRVVGEFDARDTNEEEIIACASGLRLNGSARGGPARRS